MVKLTSPRGLSGVLPAGDTRLQSLNPLLKHVVLLLCRSNIICAIQGIMRDDLSNGRHTCMVTQQGKDLPAVNINDRTRLRQRPN